MGKCKVNDTFLGKFTWARHIPGDGKAHTWWSVPREVQCLRYFEANIRGERSPIVDPEICVYQQLSLLLQVIVQLLSRMEITVALTPKKYVEKLYSDEDPRIFVTKATSLVHSNSSVVRSERTTRTYERRRNVDNQNMGFA